MVSNSSGNNSPFQLVLKIDTDRPLPSDMEILDCLVENHGIVMRAATYLEITEGDVYRAVTRNARQLSTKLRAALMIDTYKTLVKVQTTLEASLVDMMPSDVGRTYAATLSAFGNLAGQFEEKEESDADDDTSAGKQWMLDRFDAMGKREQLEQAASADDSEAVG